MARQRNNIGSTRALFQVALLVVFSCVFLPQLRVMMVWAGVALAVVLGVFLISRSATAWWEEKIKRPGGSYPAPAQPIPPTGHPTTPNPLTTNQLLEELRSIDWFQFEKLVAAMYRKLGYRVTRHGGANPDGGIDLFIEKHGEQTAVQCKHWKNRDVGVRSIREFLGALTDSGLRGGIFVTLCGYSEEAKQLAEKHGIQIVNETGMVNLFASAGVTSDPEIVAILRDPRKICPKCERDMVLRTASRGQGAGQQFWGCTAYPRCRFTMPI